ncbi:hypothetical protein HGG75_17725 [Ochrobactrum pseudogrignonense]|nr:hypothetical protein [Brucella pseudogrignonensis]
MLLREEWPSGREEGRRSRCRSRPDRRQTSPDERPHGGFAALSEENDTGSRHPIGMTGVTGGGAILPATMITMIIILRHGNSDRSRCCEFNPGRQIAYRVE